MHESWVVPLDQRGLVIYFGVGGRPFLYNGHKGVFYDSLPPRAVEMLDALPNPKEEQLARGGTALPVVAGHGLDDRVTGGKNRVRRNGLGKEIQLYQSGTHPDLLPEPRQTGFCRRLDPMRIIVYVSRACNLSCSYCVNQGGTFGTQSSLMSVEIANKTVAFIAKILSTSTRPFVVVNLFGGEPLLAHDALYVLVRGLQDLNRCGPRTKVHIVLATNGTIYDQRIFEILAEDSGCNTVVVALDAFKEAQDTNRPFTDPSRGSSYDTVVANLRRMMAAKIPCSVSCQVPYPYDYVGASEEIHRRGVETLEIRPLNRHIFGRQGLPEVFHEDLKLWKKRYLEYCDYCLETDGMHPPARHLDRLAVLSQYAGKLGSANGEIRTLSCGSADDVLAVGSDGCIVPCQMLMHDRFELGHVRSGIDAAKYARLEKWLLAHGQLRMDNEQCRNCYAKLICSASCYAQSYDREGRLAPPPELDCQIAREKVRIDLYYLSRMRKEHPEFKCDSARPS
jgi:uncharacterized protein